MAGMFKFDFYVRDWLTGTRGLSDRARGVYIDLLARMYDLGRPLDHDEKELCKFIGYRDHRQLRPVLRELLDQGKIQIQDGQIINARAMREITAFQERSETGKKGGRPSKTPSERHQKATRTAPEGDQRATSGPSQGGSFEENQATSENTSPSPSPSKKCFFSGEVIRLTEKDFTDWQTLYHGIPDLMADLTGLDEWWSGKHPPGHPKRDKWWHPIRGALNNKHQKYLTERADNDPDAGYWDDVEAGIIH